MDRKYNLKLDLQFRCNNSKMIFDEFDENTSDFFMQITRQGEKIDISNAIPTLLVLKPSGATASQLLEVKDNIIYGNLKNSLKDEVGTYIAKLMLVEGSKKTFISNISYEVTENAILGVIDDSIKSDENYSILLELLDKVSEIEVQEQFRIDNESARIEAEQDRKQTFQNLQNEVNDLLDKGLNLSSLATKEELNELSKELEIHTHEEYATKEEVPTKISELENDKKYLTKIPSEYVTETELNQKGYLTEHQDISHLATKKELFSKDYNDLTNKPTIPSVDGLATKIYVNEEIKKIDVTSQLGDYAKKSDIPIVPTKISAFSNDKGYLVSIPSEYVTETELNNKGYLTEHQDLSNYATKSELPTKTSQLTNDSGYLTSIPDEYVTEIELTSKGYVKTVNGATPNDKGNVTVPVTLEAPTIVDSIEDMTDTNKQYVLSTDGFIYTYRKVYTPGETTPNFTNLANTDGTDWMLNTRISTSSTSTESKTDVTNAISAKKGDTVYFKNVDILNPLSSSMRFGMWNDGTRVNAIEGTSVYYGKQNGYVIEYDDGVVSCKLVNQSTGESFPSEFNKVRFTVSEVTDFSNVIITVNEPIEYTTEEETYKYQWASSGILFTPSDYGSEIAEIKTDINNLEKKIGNLGDLDNNNISIPSYWKTELETKADTIQQIMENVGRNKSAFYWYTDVHWQTNAKKSPILLKYLTDNTQINKINCGGDVINDPSPYNHVNTKYVHDWRKQIANLPNHHSVLGNHDLHHWSTDVHKMAYANILAHQETNDMVVSDVDGCYYIDCPSEKTRYLYLCYLTKSQTDMMAQGQFIVDAIKDVKEGWHIVAINHRWFQYASSSTPTTGSIPAYEKEILDIFDKYNARTTRGGSNYFYAQDFTSSKGKVEFCIGGHIHADYDFTTNGGIPVIITTSDTNQQRHDGDVDSGVIGTITEQAVYAIIADYEGGKINVVGIGRGGSKEVSLN